jgi:hypothetical protein
MNYLSESDSGSLYRVGIHALWLARSVGDAWILYPLSFSQSATGTTSFATVAIPEQFAALSLRKFSALDTTRRG